MRLMNIRLNTGPRFAEGSKLLQLRPQATLLGQSSRSTYAIPEQELADAFHSAERVAEYDDQFRQPVQVVTRTTKGGFQEKTEKPLLPSDLLAEEGQKLEEGLYYDAFETGMRIRSLMEKKIMVQKTLKGASDGRYKEPPQLVLERKLQQAERNRLFQQGILIQPPQSSEEGLPPGEVGSQSLEEAFREMRREEFLINSLKDLPRSTLRWLQGDSV